MTSAIQALEGTFTEDGAGSAFGFSIFVDFNGGMTFRGTLDDVSATLTAEDDGSRSRARQGRVDLDPRARAVPRPRAQRGVLRRRRPPRGHLPLQRRAGEGKARSRASSRSPASPRK